MKRLCEQDRMQLSVFSALLYDLAVSKALGGEKDEIRLATEKEDEDIKEIVRLVWDGEMESAEAIYQYGAVLLKRRED